MNYVDLDIMLADETKAMDEHFKDALEATRRAFEREHMRDRNRWVPGSHFTQAFRAMVRERLLHYSTDA